MSAGGLELVAVEYARGLADRLESGAHVLLLLCGEPADHGVSAASRLGNVRFE